MDDRTGLEDADRRPEQRMSPAEVLALPLPDEEHRDYPSEFRTVGDFLRGLLRDLWVQQEAFDGKRPWGNSGWDAPIEKALVVAGAVDGGLDPVDGWVDWIDSKAVNRVILAAIDSMGRTP